MPIIVVLFSGKRKSGKDYVANFLSLLLAKDNCRLVRLSEPLKAQYAKDHNLDLTRLMDSSIYKENYRDDMIRWSERIRTEDPDYFCRLATVDSGQSDCPVWIITDTRRSTDLDYFRRTFPGRVLTARIECSEETRSTRNFVFTPGVDDAESECGLDGRLDWDFTITNDGDDALEKNVNELVDEIKRRLSLSEREIDSRDIPLS